MSYESTSDSGLDYLPCRYGRSKLLFRGPKRKIEGDYVAAIGGTETYGKFIEEPFVNLVETALGLPVANFGYANAGADVYVNDPSIIEACGRARVTVVQLMGAVNMSNRFYAVHPRRNDRFLRASTLMKTVFREVDFEEFNFTRQLLSSLRMRSPEKFAIMVEELKAAWVARTRALLEKIEGKTVLLWLTHEQNEAAVAEGLGAEPFLVDEAMVATVKPYAAQFLKIAPSPVALAEGTKGMHYAPLDEAAANEVPGPRAHREVAEALVPILKAML